MGFWKKLGNGLKNAGTTAWGTAAVAAAVVNSNPDLVKQILGTENGSYAAQAAGGMAIIAAITAAKKAADAKDIPKEPPKP